MTSTITRRHFSVTYRVWYLPCHRVCGTSPAKSDVAAETLPAPPGLRATMAEHIPCAMPHMPCGEVPLYWIYWVRIGFTETPNQQPSAWGSGGSKRPTVEGSLLFLGEKVANGSPEGRSKCQRPAFWARSCQGHFRAKTTKIRSLGFFSGWPKNLHMLRKPSLFPKRKRKTAWNILASSGFALQKGTPPVHGWSSSFPLKFVIWPWVQTSNTI